MSLYFQVEASSAEASGEPRWWHFARFFGLDDPLLVALLAGHRAEELPIGVDALAPKGMPPGVAESTLEEGCLTIDDEGFNLEVPDTCRREEAEKAVAAGESWLLRGGFAITHFDFYSWSWASLEELQSVLGRYEELGGAGVGEFRAVLHMMESLCASGIRSRAVYWLS